MQNPTTTPSGRKVNGGERREREEEKNNVNSGHYILPATPKGSACPLLKPRIEWPLAEVKLEGDDGVQRWSGWGRERIKNVQILRQTLLCTRPF